MKKEDIKFGPFLAAELRDYVNKAIEQVSGAEDIPNIREYVFGKIVELPTEDFLDLIEDILADQKMVPKVVTMVEEIKEELNQWEYDQAIGGDEGSSFDDEGDVQDDELQRIMQQSGIGAAEEKPQPKPQPSGKVEYKDMSQQELKDALESAIEDERYEEAAEISKYLNESENVLKNKLNSL